MIVSAVPDWLLVVDDDPVFRALLAHQGRQLGYDVAEASGSHEALDLLARHAPRCLAVLLDIQLGEESGLEVLERLGVLHPFTPVIMVTALDSVQMAVQAVRKGAWDYLPKPLDPTRLEVALTGVSRTANLRQRLASYEVASLMGGSFHGLVGESHAMRHLFQLIQTVGPSGCGVLILGESGTGKELVARALHDCSPRQQGPFVDLNCAAVARELMESELFGHEKGAFTGAEAQRKGVFERARGGTLFLDEIGEMDLALQSKLLRVLQEKTFRRVGGDANLTTDIRVVAATNRDLLARVREGKFREDLYYRLDVVTLELPPLRQRKEDIPLLVQRFLSENEDRQPAAAPVLGDIVKRAFLFHHWPGNVRELKNVVQRLQVFCAGREAGLQDLPPALRQAVQGQQDTSGENTRWEEILHSWKETGDTFGQFAPNGQRPGGIHATATDVSGQDGLAPWEGSVLPMPQVERRVIAHALKFYEGNVTQAAEALHLSRATLYRRLKEYGIAVEGMT